MIIVSGSFTRLALRWCTFAALSLAPAVFGQVADSFNPGANAAVYALALQPDGKILAGGGFTILGGASRPYLGRLNTDGTIDTNTIAGANGTVYALAVQPDGKILVGGSFTRLGTTTCTYLGRLNTNGTVDTSFTPALSGTFLPPLVSALAVQPDGGILVGGTFTSVAGQSRSFVGRLYSDGTVDSTFVPPVGYPLNSPYVIGVTSLALEPAGSVLVAGALGDASNSQLTVYLERLNSDGSLYGRFFYDLITHYNHYVTCVTLQADSSILFGGWFNKGGADLGRLNPDGSLDTTFTPTVGGTPYCLLVQTDGKILIGGSFTTLNGAACKYIGRLNADGTTDTTFNPGASNTVWALAQQADGKVIAGGSFTNVANRARNYIARLSNTLVAQQSLNYDGYNINWQRAATSPEVWRTTFEASTYGSDWFYVSDGSRVTGGWWAAGASLPSDPGVVNIRARGFLTGGEGNGSGWFVETICGPPLLLTQPVSRTNNAGTSATFTAQIAGSGPFSYQWLKAGVPLVSGGNVSGALSQTLTLNNVLSADAADYSMAVSNVFNTVTSAPATLTIVGDPSVKVQPVSVTTNAGQVAKFVVTAVGSSPLGYSWFKGTTALIDTGNISGSQASTLIVSNVLHGDSGAYSVVVTNTYGSATSSVANLTVVGDLYITAQPLSQSANLFDSASFNVSISGTPPWFYQWCKNGTNLPGATSSSLLLTNLQPADAAPYTVQITNAFSSITSAVAVLAVNVATCDAFRPEANGTVQSVAIQTDGRIFLGGGFDHIGGQARNYFARVNTDGVLDTNLNLNLGRGPYTGYVEALALQADEKVLVGGDFLYYGTQQVPDLIRINSSGAVDTAFNGGVYSVFGYPYCAALVCQSDQQILIGGCFDRLGGQGHTNVGRLLLSGAPDSSFAAATEPALYPTWGRLASIAVQPDGKILIGGLFTNLCGQIVNHIGRLNTNGTLDATFNPGANGNVNCIAVQSDGKIVIGGNFTVVASQTRSNLARLNPNGTLDTTFNPGADGYVATLALQADGKLLVGGGFTLMAGQNFNRLGRLNPDGSPDTTFIPGADGPVYALTLQPDGRVLVGGNFQNLGRQPRGCIGRLAATDPATQSLTRSNSVLTWLRGGTSPEVWRTTFEACTNGTDWFSLGPGTRITGGWQLTGLTVDPNAALRARGFVNSGQGNSSGWFVESLLPGAAVDPHPVIVVNDSAFGFHTNQFGFNLRAQPGQVVIIEATTNFVAWVPLQTNLTTSIGQVVFSDSQSGKFQRRFYRAHVYQGLLPLPSILTGSALGIQAGHFGFNVSGIAGQTLIVEASTDLQNWTALATNTLGAGPLYFSDPSPPTLPRRFYRARVQ